SLYAHDRLITCRVYWTEGSLETARLLNLNSPVLSWPVTGGRSLGYCAVEDKTRTSVRGNYFHCDRRRTEEVVARPLSRMGRAGIRLQPGIAEQMVAQLMARFA